ncbi:MAG: hypothetical protein ACPF9D_01045 [Owenweeksia sp.]
MKKLFVLIGSALSLTIVNGQAYKENFVYGNLALSTLGNYTVLNTGINYIHKGYSLEFGYSHLYRKSPSTPDDFDPWLDLYPLPPNQGSYYDQLRSAELLFGKVINTRSELVRFNLKAGLIHSRITKVVNWRKESTLTTLGSYDYYDYDLKNYQRLGFVIKPTIEFPFFQVVGLSVSPYAVLNNKAQAYGMQMNFLLGYLRYKE